MYENRHARFTAVDPLLASGKSANPQTFNRYVYTSNNPIARVDRSGEDWYYFDDIKVRRNGSSHTVRRIYWADDDPMNLSRRNRYMGPGIVYQSTGKNRGLYTALDPFEGRQKSFQTRDEAVEQYRSYLRDRNVNATRGAADALASLAAANPLTQLLYEWGADAIIGEPDPNSNVYTITNRSTNAIILVGTFTAGPAVSALRGGTTIAEGVAATGQRHHLLTRKIMGALNNHPTLKGVLRREDARFIYNALDGPAHKGYQKWHRRYDKEVIEWLQKNASATEDQFMEFLNNLHQQKWLKERIPNVKL